MLELINSVIDFFTSDEEEMAIERRHKSGQDIYRTKDGEYYFTFRFVNVGSHYEIDIVEMPPYEGRSENLHNTHRLTSNRGGHLICFENNSVVNTLEKAKMWAGIWAECTMNYINRGEEFPNE